MYLGDLGSRVNGLNTFFACDGQVTSADLQLFRLCFKGLYSPTIYIRADGNIDPQTAPIQRDGDLYFFTDNILSNIDGVVIERNDMTLDGAGYTIQGTGAYASKGLDLSGRINVTIKNLKIEGFYNGIWLHSSFGISTLGNNITENVNCGVWLSASSNSTVTGNNIKKNNGYGIVLDDSSSHITVTGNNMIENDAFGIFLEDSSYNTVSGNNIKKNLGGMLLFGFSNTIHENNITGNNEYGIVINGSSNTLSNNNITENNYDGIEAADSSYNTISGNNIEGNNGYGIVLYDSHNNFVAGNKIENNAAGMHMSLSLSNNVTGNTITNNDEGIGLLSSSSNSISGNKISNNKIGISIGIAWLHDSSSNNRIYGNNITANNEIGIILDRCPSNRFYHNNFINNAVQVENIGATNNMWDDGYPSGGNYWSDYVGPDLYKGPNQNEPGSDGIGDTPYFVDTNNPDNYPFMHPIVS
jgi:parallel beta-helix repeat protein